MKGKISLTFILTIALLSGCGEAPQTDSARNLSEAQAKFTQLCKEEFDFNLTLTPLKNTLWIYLPIDDELFQIRASQNTFNPSAHKRKYTVQFLDGYFKDGAFHLEYDIIPLIRDPKTHGYTTAYSSAYQQKRNNLTSAISRVFFNVDDTREVPEFFVMVIANTKKGIYSEETFYLHDFKRIMSPAQGMPQEEYAKRFLSEIKGDQNIVGDLTGKRINYKEVTWGDFLARQMVNRINFKFQRSNFPPESSPEEEIIAIAARTINAYTFSDFDALVLHDLREKSETRLTKDRLQSVRAPSP